jgi:integrase
VISENPKPRMHVRRRGKRKDGSTIWQARYTDPLRGGTHKIEKTFRTRQEAEDWLTSQRASVLHGTHIDPRQAERPFAEVIAAWKESWAGRLSPTTARRYDSIIDNYLAPAFGPLPIGRVTHEAVQRYINGLAANPKLAPGTVRNVYAVLRTAMARAVRMGLARVNPCTDIDLPRPRRQEMLFLTGDEVRAVAEAIDPHYRVLIYTAAYTGMRAGELGGLQRQDVDLLRGVVHVRRALKDVNGHLELGPTKTHANRTISLPTFLRSMLAGHLAKPCSGGTGPTAPVFTMKNGQLLRHGLVYNRYFRRAVVAALPADLHRLRFHDLRHTSASLSIAAGAHPKLISARLGHSSITITLDRYGHLFPSVEEALAEQLDAAFRESASASRTADDAAGTASQVVELRKVT